MRSQQNISSQSMIVEFHGRVTLRVPLSEVVWLMWWPVMCKLCVRVCVCVCVKNMEKMMSVLLMLVMLGVFIELTEAAVSCYSCEPCPDDKSTWRNCTGEVCVKGEEYGGAFHFHFPSILHSYSLPSTHLLFLPSPLFLFLFPFPSPILSIPSHPPQFKSSDTRLSCQFDEDIAAYRF